MFDYNEQIENYETACVNLPGAVKDKLRGHRQANRDRLKVNRPDDVRLNDNHFVPQGSMAINTTIQQVENDYDIDDGVWFYSDDLVKSNGTKMTPREAQEMVRDALQDDRFNKKPEIHNNCVRVFYAEGHHVDVPVYRKLNPDTTNERKELAGAAGWVESNPTEINVWFEDRVEALNKLRAGAGGQFRKMVRLLKRFARSRGEKWDMPNGLKLTMLTEERFPSYYQRDDECFYYLLAALKTRLAQSLAVENRAQTKYPKDKLTKAARDANMVELQTHVNEALDKLAVLHHPGCQKSHAREAWDWVFKSDGFFDAYDKDSAKAASLFEKRALLNAGVAQTTQRGLIVGAAAAVSGAVANLPHRFYGDDSSGQR